MESSTVSAVILFNSNGNESLYEFCVGALVALECYVRIGTGRAGKDGSSAGKGWDIKSRQNTS